MPKLPPVSSEELSTIAEILERNAAVSSPLSVAPAILQQWRARGMPVSEWVDKGWLVETKGLPTTPVYINRDKIEPVFDDVPPDSGKGIKRKLRRALMELGLLAA